MQQQTAETSTDGHHELALPGYRDADVIRFEEGLVGFPACKRFVIMENETLSPFRIFQCLDDPRVGFLVLDSTLVVQDYTRSISQDAWQTVGVTEPADQLALVISIIGSVPEESSANLQAPLLINYKEMKGRQMILTGSGYSVTHPLLPKSETAPVVRKHSAGQRSN
jgi:flagellar assembly factor FliW